MNRLFRTKEFPVALLVIIMTLAVSLRAPGFLAPKSLVNILVDSGILIMVALGQFAVILIGGIDLSVGSTMALVGMATAMTNQALPGIPAWLYLPASLGLGGILGLLTGLLVGIGGLPPLIASLATMSAFRGAVFLLSKGQWVTANEMTETFRRLPDTPILGIVSMLWITAAVALAVFIYTRYTRSGRGIYAIGGNKTAARFAGVSERNVDISVFVLSGLLAGLAGLLYVSRYGIAQSETAVGFEMQTVAASVLGGVNIAGGSGSVPGVILGCLFLGVVNNALPVLRLSPFYQMAIQGFIILAAVIVNVLIDRNKKRRLAARRIA